MTCQDDANFIGPVSLFCGIETANWSNQQFLAIGNFCKQHGIKTLFIKVSEVGSRAGDVWYGGIDGFDKNVFQPLKAIGINVIPYQFSYGPSSSNFQTDINVAVQFIQKYNVHCLDIEGADWEGDTNSAAAKCASQLAQALKPLPGKLWLSLPADYANNNQNATFQALAAATNVFMPMAYSDHLTQVYKSQMLALNSGACIQPTLDLSQEFGANDVLANAKQIKADGCLAVSLWYEGFATQNSSLVDQIVSVFGSATGAQPPPQGGTTLKLNSDGTVATAPFWYQLSENEMNTCGPTTCAMAHFSVQPGGKLVATSETIDQETDAIIKDVFGISDPKQFGGVDTWGHDMYNMLVYLRDKYHKIHFLIVSTMEDLEKGVNAGYIGIFGCNEADVTAWNKGKNAWEHAYTWNLSAGHIPGVLVGIEGGTGNWLVVDPLNNRFQGYGPPYIYKRSDIAKSFTGGAIIQLTDWLKPIPALNTWPAGFNAQVLNSGTAPPPTSPSPTTTPDKNKAFAAEWGRNPTTGIAKAAYATYWTANFAGGSLSDEFQLQGKDGKMYTAQRVHMGIWLWDGSAHYYPYKAG